MTKSRTLTFEKLEPGDLFRVKGKNEVYMKLYQPIQADDSECNYDQPHDHNDPALKDGIFYAVRNDGLPAPEFILDNESMKRWKTEVERVRWPWKK